MLSEEFDQLFGLILNVLHSVEEVKVIEKSVILSGFVSFRWLSKSCLAVDLCS